MEPLAGSFPVIQSPGKGSSLELWLAGTMEAAKGVALLGAAGIWRPPVIDASGAVQKDQLPSVSCETFCARANAAGVAAVGGARLGGAGLLAAAGRSPVDAAVDADGGVRVGGANATSVDEDDFEADGGALVGGGQGMSLLAEDSAADGGALEGAGMCGTSTVSFASGVLASEELAADGVFVVAVADGGALQGGHGQPLDAQYDSDTEKAS